MLKWSYNCSVTCHMFPPNFLMDIVFLNDNTKKTQKKPKTIGCYLIFKWFELLLVVEKKEIDKHEWNKKGKILAFFLKEAVCSFHKLYSFLNVSGGISYGLQRWTNRGYKHTSRMWYLFRIQVKNRSKPKPYPPWGHVPYFLWSVYQ